MDESTERIRLAETISWRTPDRALIPRLSIPLKRFAGQGYALISDFSDPERATVLSWMIALPGTAGWKYDSAPTSAMSKLTSFQATNIVLWISPTAPRAVLDAAHAVVPILAQAKLLAVVLQSGWGSQPEPPEDIQVVIFKKGPRMSVTGNRITFENLPTEIFFGAGPPR